MDALCKDMETVDILSVDTEGTDPDVLAAGTETLKKTRYLEFEVHRDAVDSPWGSTTLKSVIGRLHDLQFDCFWQSNQGGLFQITNCWNATYEEQSFTWANVMCVRRNDDWHESVRLIHEKQRQTKGEWVSERE